MALSLYNVPFCLKRVNEIFGAQGFQRKVVTVQDVLRPFLTLLGINFTLLMIMSFLDPMQWIIVPVEESDPFNSYGFCGFETDLGQLLEAVVGLVNFVALGILCVQVYRARDIKTEFSEARGVALVLFCWFQSSLIVLPTLGVLSSEDVQTRYVLQVMTLFANSMALLLFIFIPIIRHHQRHCRPPTGNTTRTRISGLDFDSTTGYGSPARNLGSEEQPAQRDSAADLVLVADTKEQQHYPNVPAMVLELQALRARVMELEGKECATERREGHEAATLPLPAERKWEGSTNNTQGDE
jgi:7 transmembrane sweet-taste receptor of 3 GCPR